MPDSETSGEITFHTAPHETGALPRVSGSQHPQLSVVIPAYNEKTRISKTLEDYAQALTEISHEIIVAVDGSNDDTSGAVRMVKAEFPSIGLVENSRRLGKGGGILNGFWQTTGDWVAFVDADGSLPPEELAKMVSIAASSGYDGIIASRYSGKDKVQGEYGFLRWLASRSFNLMVRKLYRLPFRDTQCGAKVFRRSPVKAVANQIKTFDYAFDVEFLWRLQREGYRIAEMPVIWKHQNGSKVRVFRVATRMLFDLLRLLLAR